MKAPPHVVYAHLKYMWANGAHEDSLKFLVKFTASVSRDLHSEAGDQYNAGKLRYQSLSRLLARCCFKQGQWQVAMYEDWSQVRQIGLATFLCLTCDYPQRPIKEILHAYWLATHYDPNWYKAWHTWALANFEVVGYLESQSEGRSDMPGDELAVHIIQAIEGKYWQYHQCLLS